MTKATEIAKPYGKSARWLNLFLQDHGVIYRSEEWWYLEEKYKAQGLAEVHFVPFCNRRSGGTAANPHLYWTEDGVKFIESLLEKDGFRKEE